LVGVGEGECIDNGFCNADTSEDEVSIASSISETVVAPTYSPITSEDDMPDDLQSDILNISQAILLSQDDISNFSQHMQSNISQAMILPPSIPAQCSISSVAEVSSTIEDYLPLICMWLMLNFALD